MFLAGALALLGTGNDPGNAGRLIVVAALDFLTGAVALALPWHRGRPVLPALLGLPAFAVLGLSTWTFGGVASGTGPFLVLIFAWAAMHFPRWVLSAYAAPAMLAYLIPLIVTHQSPMVISSAFILLPVALAVGFLIEAQARHLRDDRERLARVEQWRAAMLSTVAHDVRSPLAAVQFALEELRDDVTGHPARMLDAALRQTARINRLATGLLDVNRIESTGRLSLDRRTISAHDLVAGALSYVRGEGIEMDADDDLDVWVDRERFEQIIINLVGNALRYGRPPIVVSLSAEDSLNRLEVRDHGPGIPDDLRTNLFSRFAAGGATGVGLGLWIVRQLAEAHGGEAHAEARTPGVAMVVTFPTEFPAEAKAGRAATDSWGRP